MCQLNIIHSKGWASQGVTLFRCSYGVTLFWSIYSRLTPPLTRFAVCPKISIIRAKRFYASSKPEALS